MLKKPITYKDLDGNSVTEDFYFNLNKAEIAEMELTHEGGFAAYLQRIINTQDAGEIVTTFKSIICAAVGRRSEDGRRFIKSQEITDEFLQKEAYSELFMELVTDEGAAAEFVNGIIPKDLAEGFAKGETVLPTVQGGRPVENVELPGVIKDERPAYIRENRNPTKQELMAMSPEELQEAFRRRSVTQDELDTPTN